MYRALIKSMVKEVGKTVAAMGSRVEPILTSHQCLYHFPGLLNKEVIAGVPAADLIIPKPRPDFLPPQVMDALGYLEGSARGNKPLKDLVGSNMARFMCISDAPQERWVRLVFAVGRVWSIEIGPDTLTFQYEDKHYGLRDGKLVGGDFDGTPFQCSVLNVLYETERVTTRVPKYVTAYRCLRTSKTGLDYFRVLHQRALWDKTVTLDSVLRPQPWKLNMKTVEADVIDSDEPHKVLFKALVPYAMNTKDFRNHFGNPYTKRQSSAAVKNTLINKLYSLPFITY